MKRLIFFMTIVLFQCQVFSQNLDIRILKSINSPENLPSDKYYQFISNSAAVVVLGIPAGLAMVGIFKHDSNMFRNACVIAAASIINEGITYILKYSINRERPFDRYSFILKKSDGGNPSFPSSHASSAFATATTLSLLYPKWYIIVPSYLWAGTVSYSRMYLGVHYPSDVLGGMIVGIGSAYITYKANKWLQNYCKKKYAKQ